MNNSVFAGLGAHTQINIASPGAGNPVSFSNTDIGRYWITSVAFKFVTDPNAADRYITMKFIVAGENFVIIPEYGIKQTAGAILYWSACQGIDDYSASAAGYMALPLPTRLILPGAFDFSIEARGMQVGDLFDEIIIWALRWLDPNA